MGTISPLNNPTSGFLKYDNAFPQLGHNLFRDLLAVLSDTGWLDGSASASNRVAYLEFVVHLEVPTA